MENFCLSLQKRAHEDSLCFWTKEGEGISWKEFWERVEKRACWLSSVHDVRAGEKIGCVLERPEKLLELFMAALKIGAVPVLLNFSDLSHWKSLLQIGLPFRLCVESSQWLEGANALESFLWEETGALKNESPTFSPTEEDFFCVLYTSGSMGKPKCVEKTYRNILTELVFLQSLLALQENDAVLVLVPHIHIYGMLFGMLLPILSGAEIVYSRSLLLREVVEIAQKKHVRFLIAAPIHYQAFLKAGLEEKELDSLKTAVCSAGPLQEEVALLFTQKTCSPLLEVYGSTETGGIAYRYRNKEGAALTLFPYVQVLRHEAGEELVVASPAISRAVCSGDWYSTDDFVAWENERQFRIVGRQEQMLKVGGKRISTVQIEAQFKAISGIEDAAVLRIADEGLHGESAVAFVQLAPNVHLSPADIHRSLRQTSSYFRSIREIVLVPEIPRNQNGKIAYGKLRERLIGL